MSAIPIDGKAVAQSSQAGLRPQIESLYNSGIKPQLAVILVGNNPASRFYIRAKQRACQQLGILTRDILLPTETSQSELLEHIIALNNDQHVHAILLQLPLPPHISASVVLEKIDPHKDVDGFHPLNMGHLARGEDGLQPCTPLGILRLLEAYQINTQGAHVVIVGRSTIVGRPLALLLLRRDHQANATVTVCHSMTPDIGAITRTADILIVAIGKREYIKAPMVSKNQVVIDVGINRVSDPDAPRGYRLCGDVAYEEVRAVASHITPVPGGVGPMTIAMLLHNTVKAVKLQLA